MEATATDMPAPTVSVLLLDTQAGRAIPRSVEAALARGDLVEVRRVGGSFADLSEAFREAVGKCSGEIVWPVTPDVEIPDEAWSVLAEAARAEPDAAAFRVEVAGLAPDPRWRGRRCRSHARNLDAVRFAHLIAPGGLAIRREALLAAAEGLAADWWRDLTERLVRRTRIAPTGLAIRRAARLPGEPATPGFADPSALGRRRVLVLGQIEVSTSLYFDVLESLPDASVAFRPLTSLAIDAPHLAAAELVILVRELHRFWDEGVIAFLDAARVPYVYFTDDNFLELRAEGDAPSFYSVRRVRRALAGAAQVWVSTMALAFAYAALNPRVEVWRPAIDPILQEPQPPKGDKLTLAIAGGDFRLAGLAGPVIGRLREIAAAHDLRIVATEAGAKALAAELPGVEIIAMPLERSFRQFVRQWRRFGIDVLLHPAGATRNAPYKCPTAVIVAAYLGAQPVVASEPAYAGWGVNSGVFLLGPDARNLTVAARKARDPAWRANLGGRLADALADRFGDAGRVETLARQLAGGLPPTPDAVRILASPGFVARRIGLRLARESRRVRLPL